MARPVSVLELSTDERAELQRRVRSSTATQRDSLRARIILLRSAGRSEAEVADATAVSLNTVSLWSRRFGFGGIEGLGHAPGRGGGCRRSCRQPECRVPVVAAVRIGRYRGARRRAGTRT